MIAYREEYRSTIERVRDRLDGFHRDLLDGLDDNELELLVSFEAAA
jgi:hypothetical protein